VEQSRISTEMDAQRSNTRRQIQLSYQTALTRYRTLHTLAGRPWMTWLLVIITTLIWCFTAYKTAQATGAHTISEVLHDIANNAFSVQDKDNVALTQVLTYYGGKDNTLIIHGQYWRFVTAIFLHVNALHIGLNMLNLLALGVFLERIMGHLRFLLVYTITGVVSILASFYFMPQELSVGASGAIFGLVGAYTIFVVSHRKAFPRNGLGTLSWLIFIIGVNLSIGLFVPNVDNYAHLGGLISGFLLGWELMPLYQVQPQNTLTDAHRLSRRWPLVLLTILGTLILIIIALHLSGG
jgi:membrane associated rhomboid family serine protease